MAITWEEIKSHIDFPSIYLNSYLYLEPGDADNLLLPDRNFSAIEKDKILESLHQLFDNSPTAQAELSSYFTPNIFGITNDLNIYPNAAKKGVWTKTDNIFLDFDYILTNPIPGNYLTLLGTISSYHLGSVIYHEFLHVSDYKSAKAPPPVEVLNRNNLEAIRAAYSDPYFDHLGSVVSRTNIVMSEVGEKPRGSYAGMHYLNDTVIKDYIVSLEEKISGRYYDQAILLLTGEPVATFISDGRIIDGSPSRDLIISLQESNNITTGGGDDVVVGGFGNDTVNGGSGVDYLIGGDGNDTFNGGAGADILDGGAGNDTFNSVGFGDVIAGGAGIDTAVLDLTSQITGVTVNHLAGVGAGASWASVEYVGGTLGQGDDNVTAGMQLSNIDGYTGIDTLTLDYSGILPDGRTATELDFRNLPYNYNIEYVYLSDGTYAGFYMSSFERFNIIGTVGNDRIVGGVVGNTLLGKDGNDTLTGGAGVDVLDGGNGNDVLNGDQGNDTLNGWTGVDTMSGGLGDDIYFVENTGDVVNEALNQGVDTVSSQLTYTLPVHMENLILTGTSTINGTGNDLNNVITGNSAANQLNGQAGNDTLYGGGGNDTLTGWSGADAMIGGAGNDTYLVENVGDVVTEALNQGVDTGLTYTLPANVENLTLTGTSAINGTGNGQANKITGNSAANQLIGGAGNDTLDGGTGVNILTGGAGNDIFKFTTRGHIDRITDFNVLNDTFQLENSVFTAFTTAGILAATQFRIGTQALDADDFVIYNNATGALLYDANGNGAGAGVQIATLSAGLAITNADIVVI